LTPFFIGLIGFSVTFVCIAVLRSIALKVGYTDKPGGRKTHQHPTPVVGGMAMGIGLIVSGFFLPIALTSYEGLIAGSLLLLMVGAIDDMLDVSAKFRLLIQFVAALIVIFFGNDCIIHLGAIFGAGSVSLNYPLGLVLTVICIVGYINAMNMLDGLDGLAGGVMTLQVVFMLLLVIHAGVVIDCYFLAVLLAVLLAFLCFNFPFFGRRHAMVFMGDAGSMSLGFIIIWFSIKSSQLSPIVAHPVIFLWIAALPIFEIGYAVLRRVMIGVSPFRPDRKHLHHLLHDRGWGTLRVVAFEMSIGLITGAMGVLGQLLGWSEVLLFWSFVICFIGYTIFMSYLVYRKPLHQGVRIPS